MSQWIKRGTQEFEDLKNAVVDTDDRLWVRLDTGEVLTNVAATSMAGDKKHPKDFKGWFSLVGGSAKELSQLSVLYIMRPILP